MVLIEKGRKECYNMRIKKLTKLKMCSGASMEEIEKKLPIEDICQLLQCQSKDLIEWKVDLNPEVAYENRFKE